jgi:hypothetical protein
MKSYIEVSKFIQTDETLEKVASSIISTEITGEIIIYEFKIGDEEYRIITTKNGTATLEIFITFEFRIDKLHISKIKSFFKPVGYFYFDDDVKISFSVLKEFEIISKEQDRLFSKSEKRINIYRSSNILFNVIIACYSAEVKIVANTYFDFMDFENIEKVATPGLSMLFWTFNEPLMVNGYKLKLLSPFSLDQIQIYLLDNEKINIPIAAYLGKDEIKILPNLKENLSKIEALKLLTIDR